MVDYSQALQYTAQELASKISELEAQIGIHQQIYDSYEPIFMFLAILGISLFISYLVSEFATDFGGLTLILGTVCMACCICALVLYVILSQSLDDMNSLNDELEFLKALLENKQAVI